MNTSDSRVAVVIEDDADIRQLLATVLEQAGFETVLVGNGIDGVNAVREHNPVVTTLDVSMPGIDGFETAKRIRAFSSTYLIMLSARSEEIDTLQGLESGADDYITKPFRPRELRARIEAMLRRPRLDNGSPAVSPANAPATPNSATAAAPSHHNSGLFAASANPAAQHQGETGTVDPEVTAVLDSNEANWQEHNGLRLNSAEHRVRLDGDDVDLTRTEFSLLEALLTAGRRVLSKTELAEILRREDAAFYVSEADKRAIEVHLANLRRKLGDPPSKPRWIETVRGVGYRLTATKQD